MERKYLLLTNLKRAWWLVISVFCVNNTSRGNLTPCIKEQELGFRARLSAMKFSFEMFAGWVYLLLFPPYFKRGKITSVIKLINHSWILLNKHISYYAWYSWNVLILQILSLYQGHLSKLPDAQKPKTLLLI